MTKKEKDELIKDLKQHGLDDETIDGIIQGEKDIEQGKIYSTEEIYKNIFKNKQTCYA